MSGGQRLLLNYTSNIIDMVVSCLLVHVLVPRTSRGDQIQKSGRHKIWVIEKQYLSTERSMSSDSLQ